MKNIIIYTIDREWLGTYIRQFNKGKLNSIFYALPNSAILKEMSEKADEGFLFSIKATQELAHQREGNTAVFRAFCQLLASLTSDRNLESITEKPFVFANNHLRGHAVNAIRRLRIMLG
jgi:uncharacterized protein YecE (DUF72 family)